ncbi:MAG: hypothetical protein R3236_09915, partial [Phycisphaeraceae bacterium]|nr:hypothetical protein [Phycisphaeraceae bacterium]
MNRFGVILIFGWISSGLIGPPVAAQMKPKVRLEVSSAVHTVRFSPDGSLLAVTLSSAKNKQAQPVRLYQMPGGQPLHKRALGFDGLAFGPKGKRFAVRTPGGLAVHRVDDGRLLKQLPFKRTVCCMAYDRSGRRLIVALGGAGPEDNAVEVWDPQQPRRLSSSRLPGFPSALALSPDGERLLVCGWGGALSLYRWKQGELIAREAKIKGYKVFDVGFNPAAPSIASAHQGDPRLTLRDGRTLDVVRELHGANGHLHAVDFSPDGRLVAAAGSQRVIYVWETHQDPNTITKRTALRLSGHEGRIDSLDFSPDGRLLATADRQGVVLIWALRQRPWSQDERAQLADAESDEIWHRLGSNEPAEGMAAVQLLAGHPPQALSLIRRKLKALDTGPPDTVRQWVRDLADGDFDVREKATQRLHPFVSMYRAYFLKVQRGAEVPETRHRIGRLLRG